ncbi:serine/threonine/tyrosine-protein kinase HT1-like isoform X2 [Dioscorea cayenensis subsp. rotundata]|uniref:Serine/threonine/tyrosine-protein kinase HT1-like isoform X2 n=1 Tax=Dioscorea cayennensis subsp. rotundata TaxID=55577 RepID=A0AB40AUY0_DIOCR|nr:serine/threonine/tyrosine-protein kinase HT1-like isoform X2 [Dioscorea cayenensis subsp. rotundata]
MEEVTSSWVRRTKYSRTVCHRLDSCQSPLSVITIQADQELKPNSLGKDSSKLSSPLSSSSTIDNFNDGNSRLKPRRTSLDLPHFSFFPDQDQKSKIQHSLRNAQTDFHSHKSSLFRHKIPLLSKPNQRSLSPIPTTVLSDTFKEARADEKRFSTPPPTRKGSEKSIFGNLFSKEACDRRFLSSVTPEMSPSQHFHHRGKAISVVTTNEWMVDLSKLYLGQRFAFGAHSSLYYGIYKDQAVAVKIIRQPEDDENGVMAARLEKQFTREVTLLSHLYQRNVIKLVGACKKPPVFCIITEYLSGGSLRTFLHKLKHKPLCWPKLIAIALDIARGMEYIHSQGVIHRDLKPENVVFDQDLCAKIADFGIACEEAYFDKLAEDPGTYRWMAPEMIKHKPYGHKVDVYSFGLVLWEMVTGTIPYEEMMPIQAAFAVVDKNLRPIIPSECPAAFRALIEQCWALHPEKRPEFWQIVKMLEQFEFSLAQDGTLDHIANLPCHERKKQLVNWIQKLKPLQADCSGHKMMPKLRNKQS